MGFLAHIFIIFSHIYLIMRFLQAFITKFYSILRLQYRFALDMAHQLYPAL